MTDREIAATVLSEKELEAWALADRGMTDRNIALALNLHRSSVRDRLDNARRKIAHAKNNPPEAE